MTLKRSKRVAKWHKMTKNRHHMNKNWHKMSKTSCKITTNRNEKGGKPFPCLWPWGHFSHNLPMTPTDTSCMRQSVNKSVLNLIWNLSKYEKLCSNINNDYSDRSYWIKWKIIWLQPQWMKICYYPNAAFRKTGEGTCVTEMENANAQQGLELSVGAQAFRVCTVVSREARKHTEAFCKPSRNIIVKSCNRGDH